MLYIYRQLYLMCFGPNSSCCQCFIVRHALFHYFIYFWWQSLSVLGAPGAMKPELFITSSCHAVQGPQSATGPGCHDVMCFSYLRWLNRVLRARALMMRTLVMCVRYLTQAHAKQRTRQQYSSNYSPEVETEKPFKRKRKENGLDGKVLCVF